MRRGKRHFLWQRIFYSRLVIMALVVLTVLAGRATLRSYQSRQVVLEEKMRLTAELAEWEKRKQALQANLELLSGAGSVEAQIRNKFLVAKEGEKVILVLPPEEQETIAAVSESFWQRWWRVAAVWFGRD